MLGWPETSDIICDSWKGILKQYYSLDWRGFNLFCSSCNSKCISTEYNLVPSPLASLGRPIEITKIPNGEIRSKLNKFDARRQAKNLGNSNTKSHFRKGAGEGSWRSGRRIIYNLQMKQRNVGRWWVRKDVKEGCVLLCFEIYSTTMSSIYETSNLWSGILANCL